MHSSMYLLVKRAYSSNKKRNSLTILAVGISVFLLTAILTFSTSFYHKMIEEMRVADADVVTVAFGAGDNALNYTYLNLYTDDDIELVNQIDGVTDVTGVKGLNVSAVTYGNNKRILANSLRGINKSFLDNYKIGYTGTFPDKDDEIIIGARIADASGLQIGDSIDIDFGSQRKTFKIVGILEKQEEQLFSTFPTEINQLIATYSNNSLFETSNYIYISARVIDQNQLSEVSKKITEAINTDSNLTEALENTGLHPLVATRQNVLDMLDTWFSYILLFVYVVSVLLGIISTVNIFNIFVITIQEQFKDIAVYKIVGASIRQIRNIFIYQSVFIGTMGSVLGILLGCLLSAIVILLLHWPIRFDVYTVLIPFAIGMTSPICAGVWSSKKSEKVDINILTGNL